MCYIKLSVTSLRSQLAGKFSGSPWLSKNGICSRQERQERQVREVSISLRPLRLCGRYSEFWLRLCRAKFYVVKFFVFQPQRTQRTQRERVFTNADH